MFLVFFSLLIGLWAILSSSQGEKVSQATTTHGAEHQQTDRQPSVVDTTAKADPSDPKWMNEWKTRRMMD